jgi:hypothetical protein
MVRVLVGGGSTVELGTPVVIFDVALANGGHAEHRMPSDFHGFVYLLETPRHFETNVHG